MVGSIPWSVTTMTLRTCDKLGSVTSVCWVIDHLSVIWWTKSLSRMSVDSRMSGIWCGGGVWLEWLLVQEYWDHIVIHFEMWPMVRCLVELVKTWMKL